MKLIPKDEGQYLEHANDGILEDVYWDKEELKKAFENKYPAKKMYHVHAESMLQDGEKSFLFSEAYSLENFSADKIIDGLIDGDLEVDIRLVWCIRFWKKKRKAS